MEQVRRDPVPSAAASQDDALLRLEDLHVVFDTYQGTVHAISGANLILYRGKITGLVGETGCGKSVTAKSIMQLVGSPGRVVSGRITLDGEDLLQKSEAEMQDIRGKTIGMIFQNARAAMNPVFTVEDQMLFLLERHKGLDKTQARPVMLKALAEVGIADPEKRLTNYPFELSTGMCQRVMIAMALSCQPKLLIADEPTTGVDVTIQAQVLDLFAKLAYEHGATALIITHDLGVVAETCDYTAVMYAGKVVEFGTSEDIFENPLHPYTQGLVKSSFTADEGDELHYIPGTVPDLLNLPVGCAFAPRCSAKMDICEKEPPPLASKGMHSARCFAV